MWAKVQEIIEDIRPLVESVGCHMELVDVLNGEVTIRLTPSEFAVQHNPQRLQEFIEREVMGELSDVTKVTVESKAPPPVRKPTAVNIEVLEPPEDTDTCILTLDKVIKADGSAIFDSAAEATEIPLVQALFDVDGVASVMVKDRMIIVGRAGEAHPWPELVSQLLDAIVAFYAGTSGRKASTMDDQTLKDRVQDILDREINPAVAAHGGVIDLVDVKEGVVHLYMGGGCQGCGMASVTLSQGVRRAILAAIPEVVDIVDNTDHSAGTNPFYES